MSRPRSGAFRSRRLESAMRRRVVVLPLRSLRAESRIGRHDLEAHVVDGTVDTKDLVMFRSSMIACFRLVDEPARRAC